MIAFFQGPRVRYLSLFLFFFRFVVLRRVNCRLAPRAPLICIDVTKLVRRAFNLNDCFGKIVVYRGPTAFVRSDRPFFILSSKKQKKGIRAFIIVIFSRLVVIDY